MSMSGSESQEDGHFLVRVRAQVMTRDDSSGGWVPLGGGGLSNVSVRKRLPEKNEYLIQGKRISDQSIVLSCTIKKDFEYNKVMPTFHHWKTGNKKFGLTFQTTADARAFDKGVRMAVEELLDGITEFSPLHKYAAETGDDDVFMALELPMERDSSSSLSSRASGIGTVSSPPLGHPHHLLHHPLQSPYPSSMSQQSAQHSHLHRMVFNSSTKSNSNSGIGAPIDFGHGSSILPHSHQKIFSEKDLHREEVYSSYVQFGKGNGNNSGASLCTAHSNTITGLHDYSYPIVPDPTSTILQSSTMLSSTPPQQCSKLSSGGKLSNSSSTISSSNQKTTLTLDPLNLPAPPLLPTKSNNSNSAAFKKQRICGKRRRCRNCNEVYSEEENGRSSCSSGPDTIKNGIDYISCMGCASGMLYHCVSGSEGDVPPHPCALRHHKCKRRWLALALLSIVLPCLCLYPPLIGCHYAARKCGLCGARHHPS